MSQICSYNIWLLLLSLARPQTRAITTILYSHRDITITNNQVGSLRSPPFCMHVIQISSSCLHTCCWSVLSTGVCERADLERKKRSFGGNLSEPQIHQKRVAVYIYLFVRDLAWQQPYAHAQLLTWPVYKSCQHHCLSDPSLCRIHNSGKFMSSSAQSSVASGRWLSRHTANIRCWAWASSLTEDWSCHIMGWPRVESQNYRPPPSMCLSWKWTVWFRD